MGFQTESWDGNPKSEKRTCPKSEKEIQRFKTRKKVKKRQKTNKKLEEKETGSSLTNMNRRQTMKHRRRQINEILIGRLKFLHRVCRTKKKTNKKTTNSQENEYK